MNLQGVTIRNSFRGLQIIYPEFVESFKYSKYLVSRQDKLKALKYKRINIYNTLIVWIPTILICLIVASLGLWGALWLAPFMGMWVPFLGIIIGELTLIVGIVSVDILEDSKLIKEY